jgi:hypothetical protein
MVIRGRTPSAATKNILGNQTLNQGKSTNQQNRYVTSDMQSKNIHKYCDVTPESRSGPLLNGASLSNQPLPQIDTSGIA